MVDLGRSIAHSIPPVGRAIRPIWVRVESSLTRVTGRRLAHFIHIGKTGGIALRNAFTTAGQSSSYRVRFWGHTFRLWHVPQQDEFFFFLRDPVDRFVSAFCYRASGGTPLFPDPWSPQERKAFELFPTPDSLGRALFDDPRADLAMRSIEHVRDSFWDWFGNEDYLRSRLDSLLFVGWQERLAEDADRLAELLDMTVGLPGNDVAANRTSRSIARELSPAARDQLTRWYEADYRFIDFLFELGAIPRIPK